MNPHTCKATRTRQQLKTTHGRATRLLPTGAHQKRRPKSLQLQSPNTKRTLPSQLLKLACLMRSTEHSCHGPAAGGAAPAGGTAAPPGPSPWPRGTSTPPLWLTGRAAPQPLGDAPQVSVQPAEDLVQPLQVLRGRGPAARHGPTAPAPPALPRPALPPPGPPRALPAGSCSPGEAAGAAARGGAHPPPPRSAPSRQRRCGPGAPRYRRDPPPPSPCSQVSAPADVYIVACPLRGLTM